MFFSLPDGTRYRAKRTKRGQHHYGVVLHHVFPLPNGDQSELQNLASQHLTLAAAERALQRWLADSPHAVAGRVITAN